MDDLAVNTDEVPDWAQQYPLARPVEEKPGLWLIVLPLTFGRWRVAEADESGVTGDFY